MSAVPSELDYAMMRHAIELAARGAGAVEPNPMVGCVIVKNRQIVGEGWHWQFGGPHAEVEALRAAGDAARGAALYVTLEPCCHHGKTPPCTDAILAAGVGTVVMAQRDPFPAVAGQGFAKLQAAGLRVFDGLLTDDAQQLNAPYLKLVNTGRPWVIAKWAMSLDGKIATAAGESRWISGEASRAVVHALRGRVDAIIVGRGTAQTDDPLLTARPPGPRVATRIVLDSQASLSLDSQLVRTAADAPVLVAAGERADAAKCTALTAAGCEVLRCPGDLAAARWHSLLAELGRRRMTNVLVEGGAEVLGTLLAERSIDEVHVFVAPKLIGGSSAASPIGGAGIRPLSDALGFESLTHEICGDDIYLHGRLRT